VGREIRKPLIEFLMGHFQPIQIAGFADVYVVGNYMDTKSLDNLNRQIAGAVSDDAGVQSSTFLVDNYIHLHR
jgi:hypothetical protein